VNELEEIMSGADLAPEAAPIQQEQTPAQPRDESGRFATKSADQPIEPQQPVVEPQLTAPEQPASNGNGVPVGAVQAEREKRQEAQQRAADLERQLAELRGQVTLLSQQRQPAPQPQQEQKPASIFEDPDAYLQSQLTPVQQTIQEMREELWESKAAVLHTQATVDAAKAAADALDPASKQNLHRQLMAGGNPFDNLVKWHKQQEALTKVGGDPDAWLNAEIEKRMNDPAFLAQAIERARTGATPNPANRSQQPLVNLPPSLARLPAGGNQPADNDMSDGALFSHATR
jgi:hypothetical protein